MITLRTIALATLLALSFSAINACSDTPDVIKPSAGGAGGGGGTSGKASGGAGGSSGASGAHAAGSGGSAGEHEQDAGVETDAG